MSNKNKFFLFRRNTFAENVVASILIFVLAAILLPWSSTSAFFRQVDELCLKVVDYLPIVEGKPATLTVLASFSGREPSEPSENISNTDQTFNSITNTKDTFSNRILMHTALLIIILAFIAMLGNTIWDVCKTCLEKIHFRVRKDLELMKLGILKPLSWNTPKVFIQKVKDPNKQSRIKLDPNCILLLAGETGSGKHYKIFKRCQEHQVSPFILTYIMIMTMFAFFLFTENCLLAVLSAVLVFFIGCWSQYEFNFLDRLGWIRVYEFQGKFDDLHQLTALKDQSFLIDFCKRLIYWFSGRKNSFWLVIFPTLLIGVLSLKGLSPFTLKIIAVIYWLCVTPFVKPIPWYFCLVPLLLMWAADLLKLPLFFSFSASVIIFILTIFLTERNSGSFFRERFNREYFRREMRATRQSWSRKWQKIRQVLKQPAWEVLYEIHLRCKEFFFKFCCATLIRITVLAFLTCGSLLIIFISYTNLRSIPGLEAGNILAPLELDNPLYFLALGTCCISGLLYFIWLCLLRRIIIITREDTPFQLNHFARAIVNVYCHKAYRDMIAICYNCYQSPKYRDELILEIQKQLDLMEDKNSEDKIQPLYFDKLHAHELRDFLYQKLNGKKMKPAIREMYRLVIERTDDYTLQLICGEGRQMKFLDRIYEDLVDHSLYEIKRYSRLNSQCNDLLQELAEELLKMDHSINLNEYLGISAALLLAIQSCPNPAEEKNLITPALIKEICSDLGLLSIDADNLLESLLRREILLPHSYSDARSHRMEQNYDISDQVKQYNAFHARLQISCGELTLEANCHYQFSMVFKKTIKVLIKRKYDLTDGLINVIRHFPFELAEHPKHALAINPVRLYRLILKYYPMDPSALNLQCLFSSWADALMESYDFEQKSTLLKTCTDILSLSEKLSDDDYLIVVSELVPALAMLEEDPERWSINHRKIRRANDPELKILLNCYSAISCLSVGIFEREKKLRKRIRHLHGFLNPTTLCEKNILKIMNIQMKALHYAVPSHANKKLKNISDVQGIKFICFLFLRLRPRKINHPFPPKQYRQLLEKIDTINTKAFSHQLIESTMHKMGIEYLCQTCDRLAKLQSDTSENPIYLSAKQQTSILFWLNMACVRLLAESECQTLQKRWENVLKRNEQTSQLSHEYPSMNPFFARESCRLALKLLIQYRETNKPDPKLFDEIKRHYKQWIFAFSDTTSVVLPYVGILLCHSAHLDLHYRTYLWQKLNDAFVGFCRYELERNGKSGFLRPGYLYLQFFETNKIMLGGLQRYISAGNFPISTTLRESLKKARGTLKDFPESDNCSEIMNKTSSLIEHDFGFAYDEKYDNTKELFLNAVCVEYLIMYALKLDKNNPRLKKNTLVFRTLQKRFRKTSRVLFPERE